MMSLTSRQKLTLLRELTLFTILILSCAIPASASLKGSCSNCHTMHNSQNGQSMNFDGSATPNEALLKGTCLGCHAQGGHKRWLMSVPTTSPRFSTPTLRTWLVAISAISLGLKEVARRTPRGIILSS